MIILEDRIVRRVEFQEDIKKKNKDLVDCHKKFANLNLIKKFKH